MIKDKQKGTTYIEIVLVILLIAVPILTILGLQGMTVVAIKKGSLETKAIKLAQIKLDQVVNLAHDDWDNFTNYDDIEPFLNKYEYLDPVLKAYECKIEINAVIDPLSVSGITLDTGKMKEITVTIKWWDRNNFKTYQLSTQVASI